MAILHQATLSPTKLEILSGFVSSIPGYEDTIPGEVSLIGAYRFDDPDGKVGIECHLVDNGAGRTVHVPLTYREAPLAGAEEHLITTMEHSVLGKRWVYDAIADPVFVSEVTRVILSGDASVEQYFETDDGPVLKPPTVEARGTGEPEPSTVDSRDLVVCHDPTGQPTSAPSLLGSWGDKSSRVFAYLR